MLAGVEASRGDTDRALRVLADGRHAEEAWSLYLRALLQDDRAEAWELASRAARTDPDLRPAVRLARELAPAESPR